MKILISSFLILLSLNSCKTKTVDPVFDTFDTYVSKSDKVVIYYQDKENPRDTGSSIIINASEIERLRDLIKESIKSEDCFHQNGMISFYKEQKEFVSLEFGLNSKCPSVYIYVEGKPMTYKISYRLGQFLDYYRQKANSN